MSDAPVSISESREVYLREDGSTFTRKDIFVKLDVTFRDRMLRVLKGPPLSVFLCIALHCDASMTAFPSLSTIENETGYSRPAVLEALEFLTTTSGLVERQRRQHENGDADSNLYTIRSYFTMGDKHESPPVANVVSYHQLTTLATVANVVNPKKKPSKKNPTEEEVGALASASSLPAQSAPTSPGQPVSHPEPTPAVDLTPQTDDERALFRLAAINTAAGRRPPRARFQNAQQANDFRSAVAVLNGETVRILEAFYRGGGGGIGKAVSYVCGAARKRKTEAATAPPPVIYTYAPTSWEET